MKRNFPLPRRRLTKQEIENNRMLPQKLNTNSLGAKGWSKKNIEYKPQKANRL